MNPLILHHSPLSATHACTSGQLSGSGHRHRNPAGSAGSGRPLCEQDISDIGQWCGHKSPPRWSPRCRCSRISHTVELPQIVPGGHRSKRLHTSDSASLHGGKGERGWQELDGGLSQNTVDMSPPCHPRVCCNYIKNSQGALRTDSPWKWAVLKHQPFHYQAVL